MIVFFECKSCSFVSGYTDDDEPHFCPECGSKWYTLRFGKEREKYNGINIDGTTRDNWRWSRSMGVPAQQVDQYRKMYPNSEYRSNGDLLIKNRKHKLQQAKERNMVELA